MGGLALGQSAPIHSPVVAAPRSPDHRYGVTVPRIEVDPDNARNDLIEIRTGRVLAVLQSTTGWDRMDIGGIHPCRWSTDGSLLLWEVDGKWCPEALLLIKIEGGTVKWQNDLLGLAQGAILARTEKANPKKFRAVKKEDFNGPNWPNGFVIDVYVKGQGGERISLPLKLHADLMSNPKPLFFPHTELDSQMDAVLDGSGKLTITDFHLGIIAPRREW
jgi:hypothetical protein